MLTRQLAISQRQAEALLKAAEKQRSIIEVVTSIGVIRLIPQCYASRQTPSSQSASDDELDRELAEFEQRH